MTRAKERIVVFLKGYPRISETFIARELLALEERGFELFLVSLRHPTDAIRQDINDRIRAPVLYLPEYLHQEPMRVMRALGHAMRIPSWWRATRLWLRDLSRDPSRNRVRRFGQALVAVREMPADAIWLYAHFMHTPASVARYAAELRGLPFSISAHARDIWTSPAWEKEEKLRAARWTVTCTRGNVEHLHGLVPEADVELLYHGVDTSRFAPGEPRSGEGLVIMTVARCVPKKGLDVLIRALALLPKDLDWHYVHLGGGPLRQALEAQAIGLGIEQRCVWRGTVTQLEVAASLGQADLFIMPSRVADDGDQDGLPNVLLEAMSMGLPVVGSRISAIPEAIAEGRNGLLVPPEDPVALALAIERLARDAPLRRRLGAEGRATMQRLFSDEAGYDRLAARFASAGWTMASLAA
ncbi:Glycosyltransferase involved in cell wall bisynthesis [Arboricoccus pini]|uniref:Glycosyltransferase involved in cell wall bisynthesis n=1 Tax=Arboricoccus pini TaxID=1963835 RepID=A0A212Q1C4_9PROT|nr:glycosyltransferase [Arboricoccus pini]SNB53096.1 Glycosyltransferase involved in cell wall bisynthesis [Arboricoccus pini]